jgi:4-hydroxy-tetrahydrodipicolinate synthase
MTKNLNKKFSGVIVPMVTPFTRELLIDKTAVERILDTFHKAGVSPFLLGTTGESVSITNEQKRLLVEVAVKHLKDRATIYAGISGNSIYESLENAKIYTDLGVDAVVAHLPFYYPMAADQMLKYYEQLANAVPCPLILYNNPITTNFSIPVDVIEKLSYHPNVYGVKDSERGMERLENSISLWKTREDFSHFTGWAAQSAHASLIGTDGIVPSTGNVTPVLYKDLFSAALLGNADTANELQDKANKISEIYQKNRNLSQSLPALKIMMQVAGLCEHYVMPPLYPLNENEQEQIKEMMATGVGQLN